MQSLIKKYESAIFLSVIFLIGTLLRFYQIDFNSLWYDELFTWQQSGRKSFIDVLEYGVWKDTHPPAHIIVMYITQNLFGDSEIILRAPSAIAGALTIPVAYLLARDLYSQRVGLYAASIVACSYQLIYYSQEARVYALLGFFVLVACWTFYRLMCTEKYGDQKLCTFRLAYIVSAVLCIYSHHFGMVFVAGQFAFLVVNAKFRINIIKKELMTFLYIALASMPAAYLLVHHLFNTIGNTNWIPPLTLKFYYDLFKGMMGDSKIISIVTLGISILAIVISAKSKSYNVSHGSRYLLFCCLFVLAITTIFSITVKPMMIERYFLFLAPIVYILISQCITYLSSSKKIGNFVVVLLCTSMFYQLIWVEKYYFESSRPNTKDVSLLIKEYVESSKSNDCLIYCHAWSNKFMAQYYFDKYDIKKIPDLHISVNLFDENPTTYSEQFSEIINDEKCSRLLVFFDNIGNSHVNRFNRLKTTFENSGDITLINSHEYYKSSLRVYQ